MSIASSAVLVEMNISVWTANKLDKEATRKLTTDNSAENDAAQVRKNLMSGTTKRKAIADFASGCRLWHTKQTLPWADKGQRILPTSMFLDYKQELDARKLEFEQMVGDFIAVYPSLMATAQQSMGALYDPADYPSQEALREKFNFRYVISPIPESNDFRLQVGEQEMADVQQQYEAAYNDRLADAMREPWNRLHKSLQGLSDKLNDEDGKSKRYHDSLIINAMEMCNLLKHLNVTNDPQLEQARRDMELALSGVDVDDIREDEIYRSDVKSKVDDILGKYRW